MPSQPAPRSLKRLLTPDNVRRAIYLIGILPAVWVFYRALNDKLGADPVRALEKTLGIWALRFLIINDGCFLGHPAFSLEKRNNRSNLLVRFFRTHSRISRQTTRFEITGMEKQISPVLPITQSTLPYPGHSANAQLTAAHKNAQFD